MFNDSECILFQNVLSNYYINHNNIFEIHLKNFFLIFKVYLKKILMGCSLLMTCRQQVSHADDCGYLVKEMGLTATQYT